MARRYGAGSVYPVETIRKGKPVTKYVGAWEAGSEDGKRRRRTVTAASEAEAWRLMRAAQRKAGSSSPSRRPTESVGAFIDHWLTEVVARTRRERTLVGYRAIRAKLPAELTSMDLHDDDLDDALQVFLNRLDKHPRTVHHYAAFLRAAFTYGARKRKITRNPAADLDLPDIERVDRIPLTPAQLRAFLAATVDHPLHALFVTAGWTGMRQGELLGLRWQDVSLPRATLVVRSSLSRLPGRSRREHTRYVLTEPKTERSRRTVPLLPDVVAALEGVRRAQMLRPAKLDQGLVFCTPAGSPLDGTNVTRQFQTALRQAGLPRVRFHDIRHGAASMLIEAGVDLATVSALLGHSNIATTVDLYGHLTEQHKRAAVERLMEVAG